MIVVSDTTPIISLLKVGRLNLLSELFDEVCIPEAVFIELTENPDYKKEADEIVAASFIKRCQVKDEKFVSLLRRATGLDAGESEAIILSDDSNCDFLLMDERKGREIARQMGIHVMGTIGILKTAYLEKILSADEMREVIGILQNSGRHIGQKLYDELLEMIEAEEKDLSNTMKKVSRKR